ncbi:MAG: hypothetical protein QFF03_02405 [Pseudomonadota bacterium]|nr:hypothetical protein [Pseudomonadota bacterium]
MTSPIPFKRIALAGLGAALLSASAAALADPPARVARLAYVNGPVSFAPAGDNNWESAALNRPLIPGDRLWVEAGARDEVQVGGAALRMGGNTLVTLLNMDDRTTQLQLSQGRLNVRVRQLRPNDVFEIDTPNLALTIRQPGDYRIEVDPAGNATMVAVRSGQAEAYGDGNAYRLGTGQAFRFAGTDLRDARYARPELNDEFDRWSAAREQRIERANAARYVSRDLVGYEDLDEQGTWRSMPDYGNVWMPQHVARDWAPYRDGHWSYVQPWGWTWIDDAPWGFAVSHYGRWSRFPDGWGWVPGPRAASPVYAPALVAFVSIGAGAYAQRERPVAWFPLAPREAYRPAYRASPTYVTNINITNTTFVRNQVPRDDNRANYVNRHVGGAVTAVPATAFVHAQPVSRAALALPMAALAAAAIAHNAPVAPERDNMRGHGNPAHQPPPALMARQVLAKTAPPPAFSHAPMPGRAPADAQQAAMPAPRVLPHDRHGDARQLREVPAQPQGIAGMHAQQGVPAPMPQPRDAGSERPGDARMNGGQHGAAPGQGRPQQHVDTLAPAAMPAPMPQHGGDRMVPPPRANVPAALPEHGGNRMPPPQAHANPPMQQQPVAAPPGANPVNVQRDEMRQERGHRERDPRGMPQPPVAATVAAPPAADPVNAPRDEMRQERGHRERDPRGMPQPPVAATVAAPPAANPVNAQRDEMRQERGHRERDPRDMPQPPVAAPVNANPANAQRDDMRQEREHRERGPHGMPPQQARPEAHAVAPPAAAQPVVQHPAALPPPPPPAPVARPPEPPKAKPEQAHAAPAPAPAPAPAARPPEQPKAKPEQAHAAPPAASAPEHGKGSEGKKDDRHHRDHPEQN